MDGLMNDRRQQMIDLQSPVVDVNLGEVPLPEINERRVDIAPGQPDVLTSPYFWHCK